MIEIRDRIKNKALHEKIMTAEAAAALIKDGMNIGASGFTPAGYPKAVPLALAKLAKEKPLKVNVWTGASVGAEFDGALAETNAIQKRLPYQTNDLLRKQINSGQVQYLDLHLSHTAQMSRYGFLVGSVDIALLEVCAIKEDGSLVPTTSMGNTASFVHSAKKVIVEVNITQQQS